MTPPTLKAYILGPPRLLLDEVLLDGFVSEKAAVLLAYLCLQPGPVSRERLAGLFWGEMPETRAKANLRMALYNLQNLLPGHLDVTRRSVSIHREAGYWLDAQELADLLAGDTGSSSDTAGVLGAIQSLYRGDLLEGVFPEGSGALTDWLVIEREQLRQIAMSGLERLTESFLQNDQNGLAVEALRTLLRIEPWRESAHLRLMSTLARGGDFTAALAQYEICRERLRQALGVDPTPETERLFQRIRAARDLPVRTNLAGQPEALIGRQEELRRLCEILADPNQRLITITGQGGLGKTRLALAVAEANRNRFLHGVYLARLEGLSSPGGIPAALVGALGIPAPRKGEARAWLLHVLADREILLVLDSFEHLLPDARLLTEILNSAPDVKLLITSRERLKLGGEIVFELNELSYPGGEASEEWRNYDAVRLFVENALRTRTDFRLSEADQPALLRICQAVGGLPLGLKMAAAWTSTLSCSEIAEGIEKNLGFLAVSTLDVPERHRSMKAVFEGSWNLLSAEEQSALMRLSIFRGGFSRRAAEEVAGASLEVLRTLIEKSLLHTDGAVQHETRYRLHVLICLFAEQHLERVGETEMLTRGHLEYYLRLAEIADAAKRGEEQLAWFEKLEIEQDNLEAALRRAFDANETLTGLRLATALEGFWRQRGSITDGRSWLEAFLAKLKTPADETEKTIKARALSVDGGLAYAQGDLNEAHAACRASLDLARQLEDAGLLAADFLGLGIIAWAQSDFSEAFQLGGQSLNSFQRVNDELGAADAKRLLGQVLRLQGDYEVATEYFQQSLESYRKARDRQGMARSLESLGLIARVGGDLETAAARASESLELRRALTDTFGISYSLYNLGATAYDAGRFDDARAYLEESLTIRRGLGDQLGVAASINVLGDVALAEGDIGRAVKYFEESLSMRRTMDDKYGIVDDLAGLGQASILSDDLLEAADYWKERLELAGELGVVRIITAARTDWARLQYLLGNPVTAFGLLRENLQRCQTEGYLRGIVHDLETWAWLLEKEDEARKSLELLGCAEGLRDEIGYPRLPRENADYEGLMDTLREQAGEYDCEAILAEGHDLQVAQVLADCNLDR